MSKIMIVDDSADMREFCELIARMFALQVQQAVNASDASEQIQAGFRPDLILLDLMMPGKSPYDFVNELRSNPKLRLTRLILMSSVNDIADRAEDMGADDYIQKPLDINEFATRLLYHSQIDDPVLARADA